MGSHGSYNDVGIAGADGRDVLVQGIVMRCGGGDRDRDREHRDILVPVEVIQSQGEHGLAK